MSQGRGRRGTGAARGALAGLAAAAVIGVAEGEDCSSRGSICFDHGDVTLLIQRSASSSEPARYQALPRENRAQRGSPWTVY